MPLLEIGCCGAVCKTCPPYINKVCRGCKTGYDNGERDIYKAKCSIKICCIKKGFVSCGDCSEYTTCEYIQGLYHKKGYKYKKYKESMEFIREHGYDAFIIKTVDWTRAYGSLD